MVEWGRKTVTVNALVLADEWASGGEESLAVKLSGASECTVGDTVNQSSLCFLTMVWKPKQEKLAVANINVHCYSCHVWRLQCGTLFAQAKVNYWKWLSMACKSLLWVKSDYLQPEQIKCCCCVKVCSPLRCVSLYLCYLNSENSQNKVWLFSQNSDFKLRTKKNFRCGLVLFRVK